MSWKKKPRVFEWLILKKKLRDTLQNTKEVNTKIKEKRKKGPINTTFSLSFWTKAEGCAAKHQRGEVNTEITYNRDQSIQISPSLIESKKGILIKRTENIYIFNVFIYILTRLFFVVEAKRVFYKKVILSFFSKFHKNNFT